MKKYKYTAVNVNRKKFKGTFLANDEEHLRSLLHEQKLFLVSSRAVKDKSPNLFFSLSGKVKMTEVSSFCRQFSIMLNSGISIINSLEILKGQSYTSYFKKILSIVYEDILTGVILSTALKKHPKVFPDFFSSMVYVGEMSGLLDTVLTNLADYYETDSQMKKQAKSAMVYPIVLLVMVIGILTLMLVFVVPTFRDSLSKIEIEMPKITMFVFNLSDFFVQNWIIVFLSIFVFVVFLKMVTKTKKGKYFFDTLKINMPIVKKAQISLITARFARGFGLLLSSGMDIVDAMDIMTKVIGNKNVEKRFKMAVDDVKRGMSLTMALKCYKLFPELLIQMIAVGERTGELDSVLLRSCDFFDAEVMRSYKLLTTFLQPIMLAIMGGTIGFIFIAIYSPMLAIMQNI